MRGSGVGCSIVPPFSATLGEHNYGTTMAEPSALITGIAATGVTILGIATGLEPSVLIAGFAGGLWAQSYPPQVNIYRRLALSSTAAILAGYLAPPAAIAMVHFGAMKEIFNSSTTLQPLAAVLIGLTSHRVLGPAIMRLAAKKAEDLSK